MWFWLFITLAALCIGYRRQISARYDRWACKKGRELRYRVFHIHLRPGVDDDIIEFVGGISSPRVYFCELIELDMGKLTRTQVIENHAERTYCRHSITDLEDITMTLDSCYFENVIDKLKDEGDLKDAYIKRLVREDMKYRETHVLPQGIAVA